MKTYTSEELRSIFELHRQWMQNQSKGARANLSYADLHGLDLSGADLTCSDLYGADLSEANLTEVNLIDVNLSHTRLYKAKLDRTILPLGDIWEDYLSKIVPQLLTAGGRDLTDVVNNSWECHTWNKNNGWKGCPIAYALGINSFREAPPLLSYRVGEFVQFFDAHLIPKPEV